MRDGHGQHPLSSAMDEALRRAYLAAMEIPVWIPRDAEDPWECAPVAAAGAPDAARPATAGPALRQAAAAGPAAERAVPGATRARAILDELGEGARPARAARPGTPRAPQAPAPPAVAGEERFTLLFAHAGGTVFIDDSAGERPTRRHAELLSALVFVLERENLQPGLLPFHWPTQAGRAAGQARDAVLGRIAKLAEGMALRRVVLMGERPPRLLLGEDAPEQGARVHRLERPACAVLAIPSLARMLDDPDAKRIAWQTLRLPHG
jgi:hypothetical protein